MLSAEECSQLALARPAKLLSCVQNGVSKKDESGVEGVEADQFSAKIGIYRRPTEFTEEAFRLSHPFDDSSWLEDDVKRNIFDLLTLGVTEMQKRRAATFQYYESRAATLQDLEDIYHRSMKPHRAALVEKKKFLLLVEMCRDAGVDDPGLFDLLFSGASLIGKSGASNLFDKEDSEPAMTAEQLMKSSRWSRKVVKARVSSSSSDAALTSEVWKITEEEVSKGWLQGPLQEQEVQHLLGPLFVASPRFGLVQTDKTRCIDDMSVSLTNSAFSAGYKLALDGVDGISVLARSMMEAVDDDLQVKVVLRDGSKLCAPLHSSLNLATARALCGRTLDLEAAYKQLLVRESSLWCSVLLVAKPGGDPAYFLSQVLPFGCSSAVYAFNRVSRAIHTIGVRLFGLIWCNYYVDFPQLDLQASGDHAMETAERLMDLLGWRYSLKPAKRLSMSTSFAALGVVFDLSSSVEGKIFVRNKPSRVEQICQELDGIMAERSFSSGVAASLRGRLQFAESQTFSRAVALHMRTCHQRASGASVGSDVSELMLDEMKWARHFISTAKPRVLQAHVSSRKVLMFTDACLEDEDARAGLGRVAFVMNGNSVVNRYYMSEAVPERVLKSMQHSTPKVIAALELMAAVLGVDLLKEHLSERRTFLFIDNEAARANLISMYSPVVTQAKLLRRLFDTTAACSMYLWVSRVPSVSNIADAPSRFEVSELIRLGFQRVSPDWCAETHDLLLWTWDRFCGPETLIFSVFINRPFSWNFFVKVHDSNLFEVEQLDEEKDFNPCGLEEIYIHKVSRKALK
eukprot:s793_g4.t1